MLRFIHLLSETTPIVLKQFAIIRVLSIHRVTSKYFLLLTIRDKGNKYLFQLVYFLLMNAVHK